MHPRFLTQNNEVRWKLYRTLYTIAHHTHLEIHVRPTWYPVDSDHLSEYTYIFEKNCQSHDNSVFSFSLKRLDLSIFSC